MRRSSIDLNADLGEGVTDDRALMPLVSSCNIACGGHAGDEDTMRLCLSLAREYGTRPGAHPAYPDREGFGRTVLSMPLATLADALAEQVTRLKAHAENEHLVLTHLKPHGALYNEAARNRPLAEEIARLTAQLLPGAFLVGLPSSAMEEAARSARLPYLREGFIDRRYQPDGKLTPRSAPGSVLGSDEERLAQALAVVRGEPVDADDGTPLRLDIDTLCLHGDSPGAASTAKALAAAFAREGVAIEAPGPTLS